MFPPNHCPVPPRTGEIRGQILFPSSFDTTPGAIVPVSVAPTAAPFGAAATGGAAGSGNAVLLRMTGLANPPTSSAAFVAFGAVTGLTGTLNAAHLHGFPSKSVYAPLPTPNGATSFAYAPLNVTAAQALDVLNNKCAPLHCWVMCSAAPCAGVLSARRLRLRLPAA